MEIITAQTPVWTVEQAMAYNDAHPGRSWCSHAHPNFPYEFRGEGRDTLAYCMICGERVYGGAFERDFRPNGYIAADRAAMADPKTIAALKRIAIGGAKTRIKLGPLGRRRIVFGTTDRYEW